MKYTKIMRILGVAIIFSLLAAAAPTLPALAWANTISISPVQGKIGDSFTITGTNFAYSTDTSPKLARTFFAKDNVDVGKNIDTDVLTYKILGSPQTGALDEPDESEFTRVFTVPSALNDGTTNANVSPGTYYVYVTMTYTTGETTLIVSKATFTIIGSGIVTLNPVTGIVGTEVEITGTTFTPSTAISLKYDEDVLAIADGDSNANSSGSFSSFVNIPASMSGVHAITITVGGTAVSANFTVAPQITISPLSGPANTAVTINGTGFGRRVPINIYLDDNIMTLTSSATTDTKGTFSNARFNVPAGLAVASHKIEGDDATITASANFAVTAAAPTANTTTPAPTTTAPAPAPAPAVTAVRLNQTTGAVGSQVTIVGNGFKANSKITMKYDDKDVATATADATGLFLADFKVPAGKSGIHNLTASDGISINKFTFTVESAAPPSPKTLLPETGTRIKSLDSFDWSDVTDESQPVTYTLQIATAGDFTSGSIVLEKTGLTGSQYVPSDADHARLTAEDYYWRVRAIDGASNESAWTAPSVFAVTQPTEFLGSTFFYVALGIGAILIFLIGLLVGRRTAYYM